jgi:hypothetical protein
MMEITFMVRRISLEKDGVLRWCGAASNSASTACVNFFSCETRLHLNAYMRLYV